MVGRAKDGSAVGGGTIDVGVGPAVGATVGGVVGAPEGSGAGLALAAGAELGTRLALASATGGSVAAIGICRPPRAATKVIAKTAAAAVNRAEASTGAVSVRAPPVGLPWCTPLLIRVRPVADSSTFSPCPCARGEC